jgi:hypothetical protein
VKSSGRQNESAGTPPPPNPAELATPLPAAVPGATGGSSGAVAPGARVAPIGVSAVPDVGAVPIEGGGDPIVGASEVPIVGFSEVPMVGVSDVPRSGAAPPIVGAVDVPIVGANDVPIEGAVEAPIVGSVGVPMSGAREVPIVGDIDVPMVGRVDVPIAGKGDVPISGSSSDGALMNGNVALSRNGDGARLVAPGVVEPSGAARVEAAVPGAGGASLPAGGSKVGSVLALVPGMMPSNIDCAWSGAIAAARAHAAPK